MTLGDPKLSELCCVIVLMTFSTVNQYLRVFVKAFESKLKLV